MRGVYVKALGIAALRKRSCRALYLHAHSCSRGVKGYGNIARSQSMLAALHASIPLSWETCLPARAPARPPSARPPAPCRAYGIHGEDLALPGVVKGERATQLRHCHHDAPQPPRALETLGLECEVHGGSDNTGCTILKLSFRVTGFVACTAKQVKGMFHRPSEQQRRKCDLREYGSQEVVDSNGGIFSE
ncbi:unnamed protein product [Lampetra planeri]